MDIQQNLALKSKIDRIFDLQKTHSFKLRASTKAERVKKLNALKSWIKSNKKEIRKAIYADLKKPTPEIDLSDIFMVITEINYAIKHLSKWMSPKKVRSTLPLAGSKSSIHYEPKGVSLIISPWNYPFNLAIVPLVSAIAAGCTAILKPSEMAPHTAALIRRLVSETFEEQEAAVFEGGMEVSQALLTKPFHHIFFTGRTETGKSIMKSAADHMASVTLQLGGKSPVVIDKGCNYKDVAQKIVWGKFINCGQTCIAPDYIFVQEQVFEELVAALKTEITNMFDPNNKGIDKSKDYARIANEKHVKRLQGLLADAALKGAKIEFGGAIQEEQLYVEPTLLTQIDPEMDIMQEEIFGPLLPILKYSLIEEAIFFINQQPKPLALYLFSEEEFIADYLLKQTSSGGVCINDCAVQFGNPELPYGGVNHSGFGKAHGFYGFQAFSNEKAVLKQRKGLTLLKALYPPYGFKEKKISNLFLKWR